MKIALLGLGRMGGNMARRLCRAGIEVVGYNRSGAVTRQIAKEDGLIPAESVAQALEQLPSPKVIWVMLPSGQITEDYILQLSKTLDSGDILIDGGNANYKDSQRRGAMLAEKGIQFVDAGTSGGIWGLDNGYCLMVGGDPDAIGHIQPLLEALAPASDRGWAHVGPVGSGHFSKMIHNGIEYGMMQAMAEGFELLHGKKEFDLDLAQLAELWRHGSVVRSWLLDLTAESLDKDQKLADIAPYVADSGEGRWTVMEAIEQGTAVPVLSLALQMRFSSQDDEGYGHRLLAMMRNAFGGHAIKDAD